MSDEAKKPPATEKTPRGKKPPAPIPAPKPVKKAPAKVTGKKPKARLEEVWGAKPDDPESLFGLLMAVRRQGGGELEPRALAWLEALGIVVTFKKPKASAGLAHVPSARGRK